MMNLDSALHFFGGSQGQIEQLVEGVPEARWAEQPGGIRNHPAWTVGHLCCAYHMALSLLGQESGMPEKWLETMNIGTTPVADRGAYPAQDELLAKYREGHAKLASAAEAMTQEDSDREFPMEDYREFFPTIGHFMMYILLSHDQNHLGQLLAWRRAAGLSKG